jgi:nitroimidazol reductase NimA-like FMN-containing flavoprotein (pyridoxamine 5'-phosphate oxidase superfamily)
VITIDTRTNLEVLDATTCRELLAGQHIGRLAVVRDGRPVMFPMNFRFSDGAILLRTEACSRLAQIGETAAVFEVDDVSEQFRLGWSVIVTGRLEVITDPYEVEKAELAGLVAWSEGGKPIWLRVVPERVTGRRIVRGPVEFTD